jgi:hypothetical protein
MSFGAKNSEKNHFFSTFCVDNEIISYFCWLIGIDLEKSEKREK